MSSFTISPKEIIKVKQMFPDEDLMKLNMGEIRSCKNKSYNTKYIPVSFKRETGEYKRLCLKLVKQITSSNIKLPAKAGENPKNLLVSYRKMEDEDLKKSDYPKEKWDDLKKANTEFIDALNIIADEYDKVANSLTENTQWFLEHDFSNSDINNFRQTVRKLNKQEIQNMKKGKKVSCRVALEHPIFRFKVPINSETKEIGTKDKDGVHKYIIFDIRKNSNKKGKYKPVVAKVLVGRDKKGRPIYSNLNINNAKHFVTFLSLTAGTIDFDSVCVSSFGVSLLNRFKDLHVWPHKPMKIETINEDDVSEMEGFGTSGYNDDEIIVDEPVDEETPTRRKTKKQKNKKQKTLNYDENNDDEQPLDEDSAEDEDDDSEEDEDSEEDDSEDEPEDNQDNEEIESPKKKSKKKKKRKQ